MMSETKQILELEAPGCASIRQCNVKFVAVIGIRNKREPKILRIINATRDYRGEKRKIRVYLSSDIIVVEHYRSNRGRVYISVIWKPENVSNEEALVLAKKALGYYEEEIVA
jgi:hypothetical protein